MTNSGQVVQRSVCLAMVVAALALVSSGSLIAGGVIGDPVGPGDIKVDCDQGGRINKALASSVQGEIVVHVFGSCEQDVVIDRNRVTLRAGEPGAEIIGAESDPPTPTILVVGANHVSIEDLVVSSPDFHGISVREGSSVALTNVLLDGAAWTGISVADSSYARVTDCLARHSAFGMFVSGNSAVDFGGHVRANNNSIVGIVVDDNSSAYALPDSSFEAFDNDVAGFVVQQDAFADMRWVDAAGNVSAGLWMLQGGAMNVATGIRVGRHDVFGVLVERGQFFARGEGFVNDVLGAYYNATLSLQDISATRVITWDTMATFRDVTATDVILLFGSRAIFLFDGNSIANLRCDGTELIWGPFSCPPPLGAGLSEGEELREALASLTDLAPFRESMGTTLRTVSFEPKPVIELEAAPREQDQPRLQRSRKNAR